MAQTDDLLSSARTILNDSGAVSWTDAELLRYLNEGIAALAEYRPEEFATTAVVSLVAGTKQTVPTSGFRILKVIRAVGNDDSPGRGARQVTLDSLNAHDPNWAGATGAALREYALDPHEPTTYWVNPPQPATPLKAEISYAVYPSAAAAGQDLPVDKRYTGALLDYTLARAFEKDADYGDDPRGQMHMNQFLGVVRNGPA